MKLNYEDIEQQKVFIAKLSKGIDPTTDMIFSEDTILNNIVIKNALKGVEETLTIVIEGQDKVKHNQYARKEPFFVCEGEFKKVNISEKPITISHIAFNINEAIKRSYMKKLRAVEITEWLEDEGYLETISNDNEDYWKVPTEKGTLLGIIKVEKVNSIGKKYSANLYNEKAQEYIIRNLSMIGEKVDG